MTLFVIGSILQMGKPRHKEMKQLLIVTQPEGGRAGLPARALWLEPERSAAVLYWTVESGKFLSYCRMVQEATLSHFGILPIPGDRYHYFCWFPMRAEHRDVKQIAFEESHSQ